MTVQTWLKSRLGNNKGNNRTTHDLKRSCLMADNCPFHLLCGFPPLLLPRLWFEPSMQNHDRTIWESMPIILLKRLLVLPPYAREGEACRHHDFLLMIHRAAFSISAKFLLHIFPSRTAWLPSIAVLQTFYIVVFSVSILWRSQLCTHGWTRVYPRAIFSWIKRFAKMHSAFIILYTLTMTIIIRLMRSWASTSRCDTTQGRE